MQSVGREQCDADLGLCAAVAAQHGVIPIWYNWYVNVQTMRRTACCTAVATSRRAARALGKNA